jgi:hypothetical protein
MHAYTCLYVQYVHIRLYMHICTVHIAVYVDNIRTNMISNFIYEHILTFRFTDGNRTKKHLSQVRTRRHVARKVRKASRILIALKDHAF